MYRTKPIRSKPTYNRKDVTVIIPTITENMEELVSPFQSIIATGIKELIIVTVEDGKGLHAKCSGLAKRLLLNNPGRAEINVYSTGVRNKRTQLMAVSLMSPRRLLHLSTTIFGGRRIAFHGSSHHSRMGILDL